MASIDDVLASATRRTNTVTVSLRGDLADRHDILVRQLAAADDDERLLELAEAVKAVEAEARAAAVDFVVVSIGKKRWTELLADHPSTEEHRLSFGRGLDYNPETFPYAAIAACCVAPEGLTPDKVRELEETMTVVEWDRLWGAVLTLNIGARLPGESEAASAILRRLRPNSEQPATTTPAGASSSAGA